MQRRGNLTSVIRYLDPNNYPATTVTVKQQYDMTGNLVSQSSHGIQKNYGYSLETQYAYPQSMTQGATDPNSLNRVKTTSSYDFNTGLLRSATDANGRASVMNYYPETLRPKDIVSPTGALTSIEYDDVALRITQTQRLSVNGQVAAKTLRSVNGIGQVTKEQSLAIQGINGASDVWDIVDTGYDQFGRISNISRP